jgi:hypothetical protein
MQPWSPKNSSSLIEQPRFFSFIRTPAVIAISNGQKPWMHLAHWHRMGGNRLVTKTSIAIMFPFERERTTQVHV